MAFDKKNWAGNIAGSGYGGAPKIHAYKSSEALATIAGSGYFNSVADEMDAGDSVLVNSTATTGGGSKWYRMNKSGSTVTLAAHQ